MAITQWPAAERPRERLLKYGPKNLTDAELVAIFLRTGCIGLSAVDVARQLLSRFGGLHQLLDANMEQFCQQQGIGPAKYVQLQAVRELGLRLQQQDLETLTSLNTSTKVSTYLQCNIGHYQREVFCVLLLDNQHRLLELVELFQGTIDSASDRLITQALVDALALVDIRILDHVVVGRNEWVSFADRGFM